MNPVTTQGVSRQSLLSHHFSSQVDSLQNENDIETFRKKAVDFLTIYGEEISRLQSSRRK